VARSELTVTIRFVRGSGKVQAAAWRGAQRIQLRAARSRQSVTFTGRLSRGSWTVKLYVFPAAGWQAQTYSIPVRVR